MNLNDLKSKRTEMNRFRLTDIKKYSSTLNFKRKVNQSLNILETFFESCESSLISCGGGKDSTAVALLGKMITKNITIICANPPNPLPDRPSHNKNLSEFLNCKWIDIEYGWNVDEVINGDERYPAGLKMKILSAFSKENKIDGIVLGLRDSESLARKINHAINGSIYALKDGSKRCLPIAKWTAEDVLALALSQDAPVNPVYEKMDGVYNLDCLHDGTWWAHGLADKGAWIKRYYPDYYDLYLKSVSIGDKYISCEY